MTLVNQPAASQSTKPLGELIEDFRSCDQDLDGRIEFKEFKAFLAGLDGGMSNEEVHIGFYEIDTDHDGLIDLQEFLAWWNS